MGSKRRVCRKRRVSRKSRKGSRKSSKKSSRKGSRKSSKKSSRKGSRKGRKGSCSKKRFSNKQKTHCRRAKQALKLSHKKGISLKKAWTMV